MTAAFFYGTLVSEDVLGRVLCGPRATVEKKQEKLGELRCQPATLKGYRRWALKDRVYPGITPCTDMEGQVRGVLCDGLSTSDIALLEAYEGDEYVCRTVRVTTETLEEVDCLAYIWIAGEEHLLNRAWDLETFLKRTGAAWVGSESEFSQADQLR